MEPGSILAERVVISDFYNEDMFDVPLPSGNKKEFKNNSKQGQAKIKRYVFVQITQVCSLPRSFKRYLNLKVPVHSR